MANSVTSQIVLDGARNAVIKFEGVLDSSDLSLQVMLDPGSLQGMRNFPVQAPTGLRILKIWHNIEDGLALDLFWQADVSTRIAGFAGRGSPDYKQFDGLRNNAGAGRSGRILASSRGWSGIKSFSLIVEVEKEDSTNPASALVLQNLSAVTAFAASPRKLNRDYLGKAMRVRRSSDNVEADIGFLADGSLDTFALMNHVGAENLLTWSEDFSNAAWAKTSVSSTANIIVESAVSGDHSLFRSGSFIAQPYTFSVTGKANTRRYGMLYTYASGTVKGVLFDFLTGAFVSHADIGNQVAAYAISPADESGYFTAQITVSTGFSQFGFSLSDSATPTYVASRLPAYAGNGTSSITLAHAQLNAGSVALDYCRTTSAPTVSGSGFVAKMYDQSGNARDLVQATAGDQPRIVNAGVIDRLIVAENLLLWSEDFRNGAYTKVSGSSTDATRFTESSVFTSHYIHQGPRTVTANTPMALSVFLNPSTRRYVQVGFSNGAAGAWITVDTLNWVITESAAGAGGVVVGTSLTLSPPSAPGLYRATIIGHLGGTTTVYPVVGGAGTATPGLFPDTYLGTGLTIQILGAQLNTGSTARTYTPTTATAVALGDRNVLNKPGYRTDGVSQSMATGAFTVPQPFTRSSVLQFLSLVTDRWLLNSVNNTPQTPLFFSASRSVSMNAGASIVMASAIQAGDVATSVEIFNGASSKGSYNSLVTTGDAGANGISGNVIGQGGNSVRFSNAIFSDIIIFPSALSTPDRLTLEADQKTFYGTP